MKLIIKEGRLSFADIYTAKEKFGGQPKYSCCILIDPETAHGKDNLSRFKEICVQLEKESFGGEPLATDKYPIKKGEGRYDGWEDPVLVLSAANKKRPKIVNQRREAVEQGDIGAPESGDFCNFVIDIWAMDGQYGKRICASLEAIQLCKQGEKFTSSNVSIENDFEVISGDSATVAEVKEAFGI